MTSPVVVRITEGLQKAIGEDCGIGARLKLKFDQNGVIFIDARTKPNRVSNDDKPADCTLSMSLDTFQKVVGGEMSGQQAFLQGRVRINGDMSIALRVAPILRKR